MRDVVWTIIGVWVLYKLYNAFFYRSEHTPNEPSHSGYQPEPEIKIHSTNSNNRSKKNIDDTEYTDFEEIK